MRLKYITLAVLFIVGLSVLYLYNPIGSSFYPPCIFRKLTGFNCPGCGSARACYHLLHGHVYEALDYNVLMVLFLPVLAMGFFVQFTGRGSEAWRKISRPVPVMALICIFWILRNIDMYPFTWLNADK